MGESSSAQVFFDEIFQSESDRFSFLMNLAQPSSLCDENEWRDFKGAAKITSTHPDTPDNVRKENDRKVLEIWSEYLGAFANSGGGVLIWGIDAPKRHATGTSLVADVYKLSERLIEVANEVIDPPVQGVVVRPVPRDSSNPEGFVVCLVPPSMFAPHRSKRASREYYIRSQDGNINCPVSVLRRLFYPLTFSFLVPKVTIHASQGDDKAYYLQGAVHVTNRGHSTASDVYVVFAGAPEVHLNSDDWEKGPHNLKEYWAKRPIHPGQEVRLANNLTLVGGFHGWPDENRSVEFTIKLFAKDSVPVVRRFSVLWKTLRAAFESANKKIIIEGDHAQ